MNTNIKSWSLIATILIAPPLLVTFSKQTTAQVVKSDRQAQKQVRRAVINQVSKSFSDPASTPEVPEITIVGNYAYVNWTLGQAGGGAIAIKNGDAWRVKTYGGDWGGIERLEQDGIPRNIAEKLLNKAFPNWRQFETASKPKLSMEISFDEGTANLTVPDKNTTLSADGSQLRRYDAHIAKMFEVTHYLCKNDVQGGIEWGYQAGSGSINMGIFSISCQLADQIASAYGLGIPERTAIRFSQGESVGPLTKNYDVPKLNLTGSKLSRWMKFAQRFKPIR